MKQREEPGSPAAKEDEVSAEELEEVSGGVDVPPANSNCQSYCADDVNRMPGCGADPPP